MACSTDEKVDRAHDTATPAQSQVLGASSCVAQPHGHTWLVTFTAIDGPADQLIASSERLTGDNAAVAVHDAAVLWHYDQSQKISGRYRRQPDRDAGPRLLILNKNL